VWLVVQPSAAADADSVELAVGRVQLCGRERTVLTLPRAHRSATAPGGEPRPAASASAAETVCPSSAACASSASKTSAGNEMDRFTTDDIGPQYDHIHPR